MSVWFDNFFKKYYTSDIKYSRYAQIINSAFMMYEELNKWDFYKKIAGINLSIFILNAISVNFAVNTL